MGTKNNPGNYDCYANAAPDEPMFILLGRDKHAALLVRLWALMRHRDGESALKIEEALRCAEQMDTWLRVEKGGNPNDVPERFEALLLAATKGMAEHPEGYEHPCECDDCCTYE